MGQKQVKVKPDLFNPEDGPIRADNAHVRLDVLHFPVAVVNYDVRVPYEYDRDPNLKGSELHKLVTSAEKLLKFLLS